MNNYLYVIEQFSDPPVAAYIKNYYSNEVDKLYLQRQGGLTESEYRSLLVEYEARKNDTPDNGMGIPLRLNWNS